MHYTGPNDIALLPVFCISTVWFNAEHIIHVFPINNEHQRLVKTHIDMGGLRTEMIVTQNVKEQSIYIQMYKMLTLLEMSKIVTSNIFSNLHKLIIVAYTILINHNAAATNWLRSTMRQERFSNLTLSCMKRFNQCYVAQ